ncbi:MAG: DEAD/DEAH box helicase family protein [Bacteroidales bacterium]|nr:DEAD/DEAH box helicase family protein [Bacteroidales bacterium]
MAGSRPSPYKVELIVPPFPASQQQTFLDNLKNNPVIISKLLNRELDASALGLAERAGLKVFPSQWSDIKMTCSCPDWAVPCKHIASVIYKISQEIDNNPFLIFELHRLELLKEIQQSGIILSKNSLEVPDIKEFHFTKDAIQRNYQQENSYKRLVFTALHPLNEAIVSLLAPSPAFYVTSSTDFREKYEAVMKRLCKRLQRFASGKSPMAEIFGVPMIGETEINHHSSIQVVLDENIHPYGLLDTWKRPFRVLLHQVASIHPSQINNYQPSVAAFHTAIQFAIQLIANGAILPQIYRLSKKEYQIRWIPAAINQEVKELCIQLENIFPESMLFASGNQIKHPINKDLSINILSIIMDEIIAMESSISDTDIFLQLFFNRKSYPFSQPGEEALPGGIMAWLQKFSISQKLMTPSMIVEEISQNRFQVKVQVQLSDTDATAIACLKDILTERIFEHRRYEIIQSLTLISHLIPGLDQHINPMGKNEVILGGKEFTNFLLQIIPAIELLGIRVSLPKSLQKILRPKPSIKIKTQAKSLGMMRIDKLLEFEWQVALGEHLLDEQAFNELLYKSEGLIRYKANFIYVDKEELEKLYNHFTKIKQLSPFQLMQAALSEDYHGAVISIDDETKALIQELSEFKEIELPQGLQAQLRPYQHRGYSWMYRNARIGFGSVLADDMGLGKTIQVITGLLKFKEEKHLEKEKVLIIAPTGLLTNWIAEIERFAPGLSAIIYHGANRNLDKLKDSEILITSYGTLRSDVELLKKNKWYVLVIDEAQNIKNAGTSQSKAVKSIKANVYLALSGTPIENRLSELWSIMDYSNRGYLGSSGEFAENYGNPIEQLNDYQTAEKLKKVCSPFLMRRLKTDKSIISDLPDKIEMDCFANLSPDQVSLYEKTLEAALMEIEGINQTDHQSLFKRQGLVLQMILALKQICNHPTHFLKDNNKDPEISGKITLLFDKLDSILACGEKVLIFTQFTEMAQLLVHFIEQHYQESPLYYHGGCTIKQRNELVQRFQTNRADKIFVLSLKAAGTGLNLTAANHVIHYDLWWNPAVEAQATDRAYRIGQYSNVMVHRFITKNTFEEQINEMIVKKKHLAEMTISTGENWIGNLSNYELKELFQYKA